MLSIFPAWYYDAFENISPVLKGLPFMDQPFGFAAILVVYLYFIYKAGPRYMAKRKPYDLRTLILIYNGLQIVYNTSLMIYGYTSAVRDGYWFFTCMPSTASTAFATYLYFINKLCDLIETGFFVLRKKQNQVSVLHVYHHVAVSVGVYISLFIEPGGHATFLGFINLIVHALMYTYHFLIIYYPDKRKHFEKYKIHLTQLQITQFFLCMIHFAIPIVVPSCGFSLFLSWMALILTTGITILFANFYYWTYGLRLR